MSKTIRQQPTNPTMNSQQWTPKTSVTATYIAPTDYREPTTASETFLDAMLADYDRLNTMAVVREASAEKMDSELSALRNIARQGKKESILNRREWNAKQTRKAQRAKSWAAKLEMRRKEKARSEFREKQADVRDAQMEEVYRLEREAAELRESIDDEFYSAMAEYDRSVEETDVVDETDSDNNTGMRQRYCRVCGKSDCTSDGAQWVEDDR